MISDEIRAPLHTLNGYLDLLLSGITGTLDDRQRQMVQRARSSGERVASQVHDLLVMAYEDAGTLTMQLERIDLRPILKLTVDAAEIQASERGVTLHCLLPSALPPVMGDAERLGQVVRNLLDNALDLYAAWRPHPGGSARHDAGGGMQRERHGQRHPAGASAAHFDRYYRVAGAGGGIPAGSGQGLGLAIVKMIVERHRGWVKVDSVPRQGSAFTVSLPLC